jgi:hypothetical protein
VGEFYEVWCCPCTVLLHEITVKGICTKSTLNISISTHNTHRHCSCSCPTLSTLHALTHHMTGCPTLPTFRNAHTIYDPCSWWFRTVPNFVELARSTSEDLLVSCRCWNEWIKTAWLIIFMFRCSVIMSYPNYTGVLISP